MSLSCECDYGPDVFNQRIVKARKQHKCCECGKDISPGDEYEYTFGVWDGDASSFKTCETCADLRDSLSAAGFCMELGFLKADYQEYLELYQPQKLGGT